MDKFTAAYIECALWSSTDEERDGKPLDVNYSVEDISAETLATMSSDCADFQKAFGDLLSHAYETGYSAEQAGHDFWLTRNGHGAGFWDRGLGKIGEDLTANSKPYGSVDLYVGDDGRIYA